VWLGAWLLGAWAVVLAACALGAWCLVFPVGLEGLFLSPTTLFDHIVRSQYFPTTTLLDLDIFQQHLAILIFPNNNIFRS
jgi:hypothetical protein